MGDTDSIQPQGDKIRKAVCWISETLREHPEKSRSQIVKEAEVRFDLPPANALISTGNWTTMVAELLDPTGQQEMRP